VVWLIRCLPVEIQDALRPDLLAIKRKYPLAGPLPVDDYTWPDVPGVRRPRYAQSALAMNTLEGVFARLTDDLKLGVNALRVSEREFHPPMRGTLLVMQGARLGQVHQALSRWLSPREILEVFRQELAARR
jgi:hypothetical protein